MSDPSWHGLTIRAGKEYGCGRCRFSKLCLSSLHMNRGWANEPCNTPGEVDVRGNPLSSVEGKVHGPRSEERWIRQGSVRTGCKGGEDGLLREAARIRRKKDTAAQRLLYMCQLMHPSHHLGGFCEK